MNQQQPPPPSSGSSSNQQLKQLVDIIAKLIQQGKSPDELASRLSGRQLDLFHAIMEQQKKQQKKQQRELNRSNSSSGGLNASNSGFAETKNSNSSNTNQPSSPGSPGSEQHQNLINIVTRLVQHADTQSSSAVEDRLSGRQAELFHVLKHRNPNTNGEGGSNPQERSHDNSDSSRRSFVELDEELAAISEEDSLTESLRTSHDIDNLASRALSALEDSNNDNPNTNSYFGINSDDEDDDDDDLSPYNSDDDSTNFGEDSDEEDDDNLSACEYQSQIEKNSHVISTFRDYLLDIESGEPLGDANDEVPRLTYQKRKSEMTSGSEGSLTVIDLLKNPFEDDDSTFTEIDAERPVYLHREWEDTPNNDIRKRAKLLLSSGSNGERRRRYTHAIFRSNKLKRSLMLGLFGLCVVSLLVLGVTHWAYDAKNSDDTSPEEDALFEKGGSNMWNARQEEHDELALHHVNKEQGQYPPSSIAVESHEHSSQEQVSISEQQATVSLEASSDETQGESTSPEAADEGFSGSEEVPIQVIKDSSSSENKLVNVAGIIGTHGPSKNTGSSSGSGKNPSSSSDIATQYEPKWYDRSTGWKGKTYIDAIAFCASTHEEYIPCPYEAICPDGPGSIPTGGIKEYTTESWAPVIDAPNAWVNVGLVGLSSEYLPTAASSCAMYHDVHSVPPLWGVAKQTNAVSNVDYSPNIMCCRAPASGVIGSGGVQASRHDETSTEAGVGAAVAVSTVSNANQQSVLDKLHPVWFGRKHGYHGKTYQEAVEFCKSVGDMHLCPKAAYCPDGEQSDSPTPLYLNREAFRGEQWAPIATTGSADKVNTWIQVGTVDNKDWSTCMTYDHLHSDKPKPTWGKMDTQRELKENILCCENPASLFKEQNYVQELDPIWLDESHGWTGGSHDDAMNFCGTLGKRKLCPYTAYCPQGPGMPVIGGHTSDFNSVGEQWAPIFGEMNHWVQIGQKYGNSATTCMDNWGLEGGELSWGLSGDRKEVKNHIMCCASED